MGPPRGSNQQTCGRSVPDRLLARMRQRKRSNFARKEFATYIFHVFPGCTELSLYLEVLRLWGVQKKTKDPTDFLFIQDRAVMLLHQDDLFGCFSYQAYKNKAKTKAENINIPCNKNNNTPQQH
jgi:hypothetical protein